MQGKKSNNYIPGTFDTSAVCNVGEAAEGAGGVGVTSCGNHGHEQGHLVGTNGDETGQTETGSGDQHIKYLYDNTKRKKVT